MPTDKDALEYAVRLSAPNFHSDARGLEWSDKALNPVMVPMAEKLEVGTLSGVIDLVNERVDNLDPKYVLLHVEDFDVVSLIDRNVDGWNRRQVIAQACLVETRGFSFGSFLDHETFLIGVLSNFVPSPDRDYLVGLASSIEAGKSRTSLDDGVTQEVTLKSGVSLKTAAAIRNRLTLAPYRTFREIQQPTSEFLFRVRGGSDTAPPMLALFEADGGKWKIAAMEEIGRYLRTALKDPIPVVI